MISPRKKLLAGISAAQAVFGLIVILSPMIFELCPAEEQMHCLYSYRSDVGMAAIVIGCALVSILFRQITVTRAAAVVSAIAGVCIILYPSYITGVCGSPKMACHYGLMPVWNLSGGAIIILSVVAFVAASEEDV